MWSNVENIDRPEMRRRLPFVQKMDFEQVGVQVIALEDFEIMKYCEQVVRLCSKYGFSEEWQLYNFLIDQLGEMSADSEEGQFCNFLINQLGEMSVEQIFEKD